MHISVTRLETNGCPAKFRFKYLLKEPELPSIKMLSGDSMHKAMEAANKTGRGIEAALWGFHKFLEDNKANFERCRYGLSERWNARQSFDTWREYGRVYLEWYFKVFGPRPFGNPATRPDSYPYCEVLEKIDLGTDVFWLKIDLVTENEIIVDYKTHTATPREADIERYRHSLQFKAYVWGYWKLWGRPPRGVLIEHLVCTKNPDRLTAPLIPVEDGDLETAEKDIQENIRMIYLQHEHDLWPRRRDRCFDYQEACPFMEKCFKRVTMEDL